jgi:hypothetical protein
MELTGLSDSELAEKIKQAEALLKALLDESRKRSQT